MRIIKKINTSAALAVDRHGNEIVVLGKGVGYPPVPYELTDLSRIERTFYNVDPRYLPLLTDLPQPILLASADIVEEAEMELDCQLSPNLPFTLADHLNFAVQRLHSGLALTNPIAYDIRHLYPREYALGSQALELLRQQAGVALPEDEAVSIALHLINSQADGSSLQSVMQTMEILNDVEQIVQAQLHFTLNRDSYNYSRFATHLRYLIQRLESGRPGEEKCAGMLGPMAREYPDVYTCALAVSDYFRANRGWKCSKEEILYLMLHIQRVRERTDQSTS